MRSTASRLRPETGLVARVGTLRSLHLVSGGDTPSAVGTIDTGEALQAFQVTGSAGVERLKSHQLGALIWVLGALEDRPAPRATEVCGAQAGPASMGGAQTVLSIVRLA